MKKGMRALTALASALAVISGAIAVPILFRPFYYWQVEALHIAQRTGYSVGVIRKAFDEVMDYLVLGTPFGTGELAYSMDGKAHFADCRGLFVFDFWVLGISLLVLVICLVVYHVQKKKGAAVSGAKHLPVFWSSVVMCGFFAVLAVWGAVDFDSLFVAFHAAFFPGKSNWIFDPRYDEIINILPQQFFLNCAVLIAVLVFLSVTAFFIADIVWRKKKGLCK